MPDTITLSKTGTGYQVIRFTFLLSAVFLIKACVDDIQVRILALLVTVTLSLFGLYGLNKNVSIKPRIHINLIGLAIGICGGIYTNGGIDSHIMTWLLFLPLIAGLCLNTRSMVVWGAIALILFLLTLLLDLNQQIPTSLIDQQQWRQDRLHQFSQIMMLTLICWQYLRQLDLSNKSIHEKIDLLNTEVKQRKKAEDASVRALEDRDRFLSSMSHELRTPLNSIIGFSDRLIRRCPQDDTRQLTALTTIHRCGKHLEVIIGQLLDIDIIQRNQLNLTKASLHPESTIKTLIEKQDQSNRITITSTLTTGYNTHGDKRLFSLCIEHIIHFFTSQEDHHITHLTVKEKSKIVNNKMKSGLSIVIDNPEISLDIASSKNLFDAYNHDTLMTSQQSLSSGLSLPLVAKMIELQQGTIYSCLQEPKGMSIGIWLPKDL